MASPGKSHRKGISLNQLFKKFPDDEAARKWIEASRWPDGPLCPHCGSANVQSDIKHPQMTHRCRNCPKRRMFTVKTGTVMQSSPLGYQIWAIAIYMMSTNLKSVSAMRLHRDLGITHKSAWFLMHRLREAMKEVQQPFLGPVEADETYMGGKRKNMSKKKRKQLKGPWHSGQDHRGWGERPQDQPSQRRRDRGNGRPAPCTPS